MILYKRLIINKFFYILKLQTMEKLKDSKVQQIIEEEIDRQQNELEMIASENYISPEVMKAYSNVFTNKYSEGYPNKRYYWGQKNVDQIERLAQYRALKIFNLIEEVNENETDFKKKFEDKLKDNKWWVNVQPLSWAPANLAVYIGMLNPWDTILSMDLNAGWHLTHWHKLNTSGIFYNIIHYWVDKENFKIDFEEIEKKALENKPALILAWYSSYPRDIDREKFEKIAQKVKEEHWYRPLLMADIAHIAGLIAGGKLNSPFPYFDIITTTTHKTLRGPRWGLIYYKKEWNKDINKKINRWLFPWVQGWPHQHIIAAKAVAFGEILKDKRSEYSQKVIENAQTLAKELKDHGWNILTGWTDNHMILMDVTQKNNKSTWISWKQAEKILEDVGISVNKNLLPWDERNPMDPSGLRLWTPTLTTRGLWKEQIIQIAEIIDQTLENTEDVKKLKTSKDKIQKICKEFPLNY